MAKFYTKEQMDGLATIIGDKIKTAAVTAATETASFISALDSAIAAAVDKLVGNSVVVIGNQSGQEFHNYRATIDGMTFNEDESSIIGVWGELSFPMGSKAGDLSFELHAESKGIEVFNYGSEPITVKLEATGGTPIVTNEFLVGEGNSEADGSMFEFIILPVMMEEAEMPQ